MPNVLKITLLMNTFTKISTGICTNKLQEQISFKIFTVKYNWHKDCLVGYWSPKIIHFPLPPKQVLETGFLIRQKFPYIIRCDTLLGRKRHCCLEINLLD